MQKKHEITPLLLAGISKKTLFVPATVLALLLSLISFANTEYLLPLSQEKIAEIKSSKSKSYETRQNRVTSITLKDGSTIIYQKKERKVLYDLFWLQQGHTIWHMKSLELTKPYKGHFVDQFQKNHDHQFVKINSFDEKDFVEMKSIPKESSRSTPYEYRPLSQLIRQVLSSKPISYKEKNSLLTHLHYKLVMALLPCLLLIALPPFLLSFERDKKIFIFTAISITSFIAFYTLLDALFILGDNQVLYPPIALWTPFLLLSAFFSKRLLSHY